MTITPLQGPSPPIPPDHAGSEPSRAFPAVHAQAPRDTAAGAPLLNPDPVINPSLGIVVLQYFSRAGTPTESFPSRQQLDSYELYGLKGTPRTAG